MIDIGPFRLLNPPDGQAEIVRAAYEAIDFPWERFAVALARDSDHAILVEWNDTGQGVSGLAYGYTMRIVLSDRLYHLGSSVGFVFAHEVGHLVDSATLRDEDREALMELMHGDPKTNRYNGQQMNGGEHELSHNKEHVEEWRSSNDYLFRHNEAFADLFVEAFAPTVWDGSFYPDAPARGADWLRFIHTTDDLEMVKELVLWTPPLADDPEPKEDVLTRGAYIDRAIADMTRWLKRHPKRTKKRLKVLAARRILRSIRPR